MKDILPYFASSITALFGISAMIQPLKFAALIALIPKGKRGISEIRATYGGMIFALGAFAIWSGSTEVFQGLGFAWLAIGSMRSLSFLLDNSYSPLNLKVVIFELFIATLLLI